MYKCINKANKTDLFTRSFICLFTLVFVFASAQPVNAQIVTSAQIKAKIANQLCESYKKQISDAEIEVKIMATPFAEIQLPEGKVTYKITQGADRITPRDIKRIDVANGPGVRVTLFVSGCTHHCKGCFQPETWDFDYGKPFTEETENEIIEALKPSYINGLTVLGGEPFEPENQKILAPFLQKIKELFPEKNIWCYTGYIIEKDLLPQTGRKHCNSTNLMLSCIDVLVDGPFIEEEKNISLAFRGSENQRIIKLSKKYKIIDNKLFKNPNCSMIELDKRIIKLSKK